MDKYPINFDNPTPGAEPRFSIGDWVCLDRNLYQVQIEIEAEWPLPIYERHLQNFSARTIVELSRAVSSELDDESDEIWYNVGAKKVELWLPESWLYLANASEINYGVFHAAALVSNLLPIASQISVAGKTFNFKILPADQLNGR